MSKSASELGVRAMVLIAEATAKGWPALLIVINPGDSVADAKSTLAVTYGDKMPEVMAKLLLGATCAFVAQTAQTDALQEIARRSVDG